MNGKGDYNNFLLNNDDLTSTNPFATSGIPGVNTSDAFALPPGGGFVYDNPFTDMVIFWTEYFFFGKLKCKIGLYLILERY